MIAGRPSIQGDEVEEFWALKDISFEIKRGETIGIIGRNGAGKSTLLKILSRITEPTNGQITIDGRVASLLEVGTGFHPELTGRENIFLNGAILGMARAEIRRKFDEIVAFAEVEKFLDTPVKRYSSGMYVRLAFSVAAHLEPEILIVDEVLAVGDIAFQEKCLGKMGDVSSSGRTVLFVSHNMAAVTSLCIKSILLESHKIKSFDYSQEVIEEYIRGMTEHQPIPLIARLDRSGTGEARLVNVSISPLEPNGFIYCNSELEITISYTCNKHIDNPSFAIGIFDYSGAEIYFIAGNKANGIPGFLSCEGSVKCNLGPINITPGRCYLNIAIAQGNLLENGTLIDYIQHAISFEVRERAISNMTIYPRNWSLCLIEHEWSSGL